MNAPSAIVGSVVVITGLTLVRDSANGHPQMRPVVTGFMLGSALLLIAFFAPNLAKTLAYLGVIGAVITNGPEVASKLGRIGS